MNFKNLALFSGAMLLAGCPGASPTTGLPSDTSTPTETDTDTDVVTPDPFEWNIVLTDGDGVADTSGVADADTTAVSTVNSIDNYPSIDEWEFGFAQTEASGGWTGEDCDGVVTQGLDACHLFDPDTTMTLTRVGAIGDIVPGSTTLNNVDFPESGTPGITYIVFGYDSTNTIVECFVQGHQVSYYASSGCDTYTPAM